MTHALPGSTCTGLLVLAFVDRLLRRQSSGPVAAAGRPTAAPPAVRAGAALLPAAACTALLGTGTGVAGILMVGAIVTGRA